MHSNHLYFVRDGFTILEPRHPQPRRVVLTQADDAGHGAHEFLEAHVLARREQEGHFGLEFAEMHAVRDVVERHGWEKAAVEFGDVLFLGGMAGGVCSCCEFDWGW